MPAALSAEFRSVVNNSSVEIRPEMNRLLSPLTEYYNLLMARLGPQRWWPGDSDFEIIVGAILTQNTNWTNVEKAIANLKAENLLSAEAIRDVAPSHLEQLLRPSGYFRQKARKLKAFVEFLQGEFGGSMEAMFLTPTAELREKLLGVFGVGPETADSILLYAGRQPVFVVDAYTKRMLVRHGLVPPDALYEEIQALLESEIACDVKVFNEFHALIVSAGKQWCRRSAASCEQCPLGPFLEAGR
jgi:endonuclease III related protein